MPVPDDVLVRAVKLTVRLDDDDLVQMALLDGPGTVDQIVAFVDWVDHVRWPADEMIARLERLAGRGVVGKDGDRWVLRGEWP